MRARERRPRTGFAFLDAPLDQPGAVLAFAHRGGAYHPEIEGLENTVAAFEHAVALGYHYLETDVQATRDGVLLAFHDDVLDRVTGTAGVVSAMSHREVASALIGGREEIPSLAALLEHLPTARFNVDLKSAAAVEPLVALLRASRAHERVCVVSFSEARLRAFRALCDLPVATAAGPLGTGVMSLPCARRGAARLSGAGQVLQVPTHVGRWPLLTRGYVDRAHRAGLHVHVWVVDDPAQMHDVLDLGVDGIMTDRTDLLREVLLARDQWWQPA